MPQSESRPDLQPFNPVSFLCPRFWHGMETNDYVKLLREHRMQIDRWSTAISCLIASGGVYLLNGTQSLIVGQKAAKTRLVEDPVFILGHWRSGTTLLQELMTLDPNFVCPNTFECFTPNAFLTCDFWLKPLTSILLPRKRPMDNMRMGWDAPMEDEFALLVMGLPTTYRRVAFPNDIPRHLDYLTMEGIPGPELERWKAGLLRFVQNLNYRYGRKGRRLLFKSPPHTGRVRLLLEMFPRAKFIHITRNPLKFIPSTIHMWAALDHTNALQTPDHGGIRSFVFDSFRRIYKGFDRDRELLTEQNSIDVRFEDLLKDFSGVMAQIYGRLDLGDYDRNARAAVETEMEKSRSYKGNKHELAEDLREEIIATCGHYMEQYGYASESVAPSNASRSA